MALTRRDILKGITLGSSSMVLSPIVNQLAAHADGVQQMPKRFVFVVKSSGLTPAALVPETLMDERVTLAKPKGSGAGYSIGDRLNPTDKLIDISLAEHKLPESLAPLNAVKKRMTILQGLSGQMCNGGHSSWYGALGCYKTNSSTHDGGTPIAPTIDGMLAAAFPSVFPHMGFALSGRLMGGPRFTDSVVYPDISAAGRGRPLPFHGSPQQAYRSMFGSIAKGNARKQFDLQAKVLDFMREDVRRLEARVPAAEKERLAHHLEALEAMQSRGTQLAAMGDRLRAGAPKPSDRFTSEVETDRIDAHFDLAAAGLITGLTNVVTIRPDSLGTHYSGLGIGDNGVHGIGHGGDANGKSPAEARAIIRKFHCEQIAKLAGKLDAVSEGNGTMLDNTVIIYLSDSGNEHHASLEEWPMIVIGNLGGRLKTDGRYLQFPNKGVVGHRTIAHWWMTVLHAAGRPQNTFGMLDGDLSPKEQTGPLAELLA